MDGSRRQLAFAIVILVALAATLAIAGPSGAPATAEPDGRPDSGPALDRAAWCASAAVRPRRSRAASSGIRGLRFKDIPDPEVVDSEFLNRLGLREATRGAGGLGLGADDAFGAITGLLGPDERLEAAYESTGDLAAAAYDPETKRLYVVSDAVVANRALVEFVLAHELDHAIEDQNFGLPGEDAIDDDQALAETALTEGSATSVMTDYAARNLDPFELSGGDRRHRHGHRRRAEGLRRPAHLGLPGRAAVHQCPPGARRELEAGRLRARVAPAGEHRADPAPAQVRPGRAARSRCGSTARRCGPRAGGAPTATCSASCRRRSCSSSGSSTRSRNAPPPAGTVTATSSGVATWPPPTANTRAGPTWCSWRSGASTRGATHGSSSAPARSTSSAASTRGRADAPPGESAADTRRSPGPAASAALVFAPEGRLALRTALAQVRDLT